jgi:hypothetical protein
VGARVHVLRHTAQERHSGLTGRQAQRRANGQQLLAVRRHGQERPHGGLAIGSEGGTRASHGSVFDIALHSAIVKGDDAFEKFVALLTAFLKMRSAATLQVNVIDRDTLLKARANPDSPEFRTLIVRVWGFSAVFVDLPEGLQDHVIARTEHGSMLS